MSIKSHLATFIIVLIVGFLGGTSSQYFQSKSRPVDQVEARHNTDSSKPYQVQTGSIDVVLQIAQIQKKINWIEMQLSTIAQNHAILAENLQDITQDITEAGIPQSPEISERDNLISAGVNPDIADNILRRISQQEFRSIELRNLMRRNASSGTRQYSDELRELDQNRITLRSELGEDKYDQYLIVSGQNNRVKVSLVMAGSPAESNGLQKGDVILYYGDQKIVNVNDMRKVALEGDIGGLANIEVLRDGNHMTLTVPRGTLGVQLEAIQLNPTQ